MNIGWRQIIYIQCHKTNGINDLMNIVVSANICVRFACMGMDKNNFEF